MSKQDMGPLGSVDLLTNKELHDTMGHHLDHYLREKYKGVDYMGLAGPGNGTNTITLPGPDQGYAWSYKEISVQLAPVSTSALATVYSAVGSRPNPVGSQSIVSITIAVAGFYNVTASVSLSGTVSTADINNVALTGGGAAQIAVPNGNQSGGQLYQTGPYLNYYAAGTVLTLITIGTGSGTATYWGAIEATPGNYGIIGAGVLSAYPSDNTNVAPIGVATAVTNGANTDAIIQFPTNAVVLKDGRNITLLATQVIQNWRILVLQVPVEMQGKL
jgi:hypothetical protein